MQQLVFQIQHDSLRSNRLKKVKCVVLSYNIDMKFNVKRKNYIIQATRKQKIKLSR